MARSELKHRPSHLRVEFQDWLDSYEPNRLHEIDVRPVASLLDALADEGRSCVLLGSPAERELAAAIIAGATHQPVDLVGRTSLRELAALLAISDLVICQDSGPMHIAAALGKPVVALFGPTSPARTGPYCPAARVVTLSLECAPCYSRTCPFGHQRCLRDLEVDRVLRAVREITLLEIAEPT